MAEHTPGPWEAYDGHDHALGHWLVLTEDHVVVCDTLFDGPTHEANARLIAAAPDLLAALIDIAGERFTPQAGYNAYNLDGMLTEAQELARAAIAKAEAA
jgi:hypothetical protein